MHVLKMATAIYFANSDNSKKLAIFFLKFRAFFPSMSALRIWKNVTTNKTVTIWRVNACRISISVIDIY